MNEVPADLHDLMGRPMFAQTSDGVIEAGAIRLFASVVRDGHAPYWPADGTLPVAPPALLSAWNRPLHWRPEGDEPAPGLALHFLVKQRLGLSRAVVVESDTEVVAPMRAGARVRCEQVLVEIGEPCRNRLGEGRYWTLRVDYRCADSAVLFGAETMRFFGYEPDAAA